MKSRQEAVDALLRPFPEDQVDRLFHLRKEGPDVFARLTGGSPPHGVSMSRMANRGAHGVRLEVIKVGSAYHSTMRFLVEYLVDSTRAAQPPVTKSEPRRKRA